MIPPEIRTRHAILITGKLRKAEFNPDGSVKRLYIGRYYPVAFYNTDNLELI